MADTLQFDLVSPERRLASFVAAEVRIPGAEGDLTAMAGHAPVITTLRPGILTVVRAEGSEDYAVTGGFAEVTATGASVLAELALPRAQMTADMLDTLIAEAAEAAGAASGARKDAAEKGLADLRMLKTALGH